LDKKANFDAVSMQVSSTEKTLLGIVLWSVAIMLTRIINEYLVAKKCIFCQFPLAHEQKIFTCKFKIGLSLIMQFFGLKINMSQF